MLNGFKLQFFSRALDDDDEIPFQGKYERDVAGIWSLYMFTVRIC